MPHRIDPAIIAADRATLKALEELVDYQPINQAYSTGTLQQIEGTLTQADEAEERAWRAYVQARLVRSETMRTFHKAILGAKAQVLAQYGDDSFAVKAACRPA